MTPDGFYADLLNPTLDEIAEFAPMMTRNRALRVLMTSIAGQESNWEHRVQIPSGMAHSLFQIEEATIPLIIANPASKELFTVGMDHFQIQDRSAPALFDLMADEAGDKVSVLFARLLLWCNPKPIPYEDEEQALFKYYRETWRPKHAVWARWPVVYGQAMMVVPNA